MFIDLFTTYVLIFCCSQRRAKGWRRSMGWLFHHSVSSSVSTQHLLALVRAVLGDWSSRWIIYRSCPELSQTTAATPATLPPLPRPWHVIKSARSFKNTASLLNGQEEKARAAAAAAAALFGLMKMTQHHIFISSSVRKVREVLQQDWANFLDW